MEYVSQHTENSRGVKKEKQKGGEVPVHLFYIEQSIHL